LREFKDGLEDLMKSMVLGHFKNKDRILKKILNMKLKEKHPRERSNL
jgi:hypothetical protein